MSKSTDRFKATLRRHGYSTTKARQAVFAALSGQEPQTIAQLIKACAGVDRASIYRTISLLEQLGIVQRLQIGWKYKLELSGDFMEHHHHLSCTGCGNVIALPEDAAIEQRLYALAASQHFTPTDHQLEIRGLCKACAAKGRLVS